MIPIPPAIVVPAFVFLPEAEIEGISQCESGGNDRKVGLDGELGHLQFTRGLWMQFSSDDYRLAVRRDHSDFVAKKVFARWSAVLLSRGARPKDLPYLIGLSWRAGLNGCLSGNYDAKMRDEAERIARIYKTISP